MRLTRKQKGDQAMAADPRIMVLEDGAKRTYWCFLRAGERHSAKVEDIVAALAAMDALPERPRVAKGVIVEPSPCCPSPNMGPDCRCLSCGSDEFFVRPNLLAMSMRCWA